MNAVVKEIKKEEVRDLMPVRMKIAEVCRNIYQAVVESTVTRQDLQDSSFWKHVSRQFEPYTRIEVVTDDGKYFAELLVITAGSNYAVVKELSFTELQQTDAAKEAGLMDDFEYKFRGPHHKHSIIRKSDGDVIKTGMASKDEALRFLSQHIRVISK